MKVWHPGLCSEAGRIGVWIGNRVFIVVLIVLGAGCRRDADDAVLYCSADEEFARGVVDEFRRETNLQVKVLFDTEAGKTMGLVRKIEAEKASPRADVFWSGEVFNTILLARQGLLQSYRPKTAEDIEARYRCPEGYWVGFGLRGRVLAFNTTLVAADRVPRRWADLADPNWARQLVMANPQFGTTRGHVSAMFALWGPAKAGEYLEHLRKGGVRITDGNAAAIRMVGSGQIALCMTDTDDVWVARKRGMPVDLVYPEMAEGQGTLLIPNTVAILRGCRHPQAAERLADFLVSAKVEKMLAQTDSRNVPVRPALRKELGITLPAGATIGYAAVAGAMNAAIDKARETLLR